MTYKLAFLTTAGETARLWMCDAKRGARSVILSSYDDAVAALLGEGWEPFGLGSDGALWFRKPDETGSWLPVHGDISKAPAEALAPELAPA